MKNWEKKKLGDVCGFVRGPFGGSLKKNIFKADGYAVYEQQHAIYDQFEDIRYFIDENKFNEMRRFELKSGDLIMSCSGTMGKIAIVPENIKKGIINQALLKLTPSPKKISTVFLKLWMQSESFQDSLKEYSGGAAIQNVASVAILKQIEIPLPPLPEQKRIVAILDEAFAALAKAKANAEQNLKNAKELFESYLQGVFENKGEGWEEKTLGEVCEYDKNSNKRDDLPYVGLEDIQSNTGKFIGPFEPRSMKSLTFYFNEAHVLYGRLRPYLNKVLLPDFEGHCSTEIFPIKPKKNVLDRGFLFRWLIAAKTMKKINATWTGATLPRANMSTVLEFKINLPSFKEQKAIVQKLDELSTEIKKLEAIYIQKINDLEELKKSVLQKAFSGELKTNKSDLKTRKKVMA